MRDDNTHLQQLIQSHRKHSFMNLIISSGLNLFEFKNASGYLSNFIRKSKLFLSSTPAKQVFKTCKLLYGYIFLAFRCGGKIPKQFFMAEL